MRVLLVDHDIAFTQNLAQELSCQGIDTVVVSQGREAFGRCDTVDAILLELNLPDIDGFQVCQRIRLSSSVPIIILSYRSEEFDRVLGLKLGADDYVVKPCRMRELSARIEAVVRRAQGNWPILQGNHITTIEKMRVDRHLRQVTINGREVTLTPKEFNLISLLASEPGRTFTREEIMDKVWGYTGAGDTRTLGVHMASIRKKVGMSVHIETVRGVGFRLVG